MTLHVARGDRERRRRDVRRVHFDVRRIVSGGDRDAAAARADIEHAVSALQRAPRLEASLDELREWRARHEHALVDVKLQTGEPRFVQQVSERLALGYAARGDGERVLRELEGWRRCRIDLAPTLLMAQ